MDVVTVNQVKYYNVSLVKQALRSIPTGTKNDIARLTGLSVATCNTLLNELAQTGEIIELQNNTPCIGRPPKLFRFNESYAYVCCLFLKKVGRTFAVLHYAVADLNGNFVCENEESYDEISFDIIVDRIARLKELYHKISMISMGVPGYYHKNRIRTSGRPVFEGRDVVKELYDRFACDIYVENDMNATAFGLYYYRDDIIKRNENIVLITMLKEDSMGAGTVIDGKILHGQTYFAGELLHMEYSGKSVRELLRSGREGVIDVATHQVINISALINPAIIVFTGNNISEYEIDAIREGALKYISEDNMPRILYKCHFERYYLQGLAAIALDKNNISLSEKYFASKL